MDAKTGANIKTGKLNIGDKSWSFPIYDGTIGPEVMDISKLYGETGMFTFDPASPRPRAANPRSPTSTAKGHAAAIAAIRSRTGGEQRLHDLLSPAQRRIADRRRRRDFKRTITCIPWCMSRSSFSFSGFRRDAHPMAVMCGVVGALSAFYHD